MAFYTKLSASKSENKIGAATVFADTSFGAERSSLEISNADKPTTKMTEAILDAEQLNAKITEICVPLSTLSTRERELHNINNAVDLIETTDSFFANLKLVLNLSNVTKLLL